MQFVCPLPLRWRDIYLSLRRAWEQSGRLGDGPPKPFILSGWVFSSDYDKHQTWQDTIEWAKERGLSELIPELSDGEKHLVFQFSNYDGPVLGEQFEKPKATPSVEELKRMITELQDNWATVVGPELAAMTHPTKFTGRKKRQLVIRADANARCPWGEWNWFRRDGNRRAFKEFRKRINDAISPHGVDHVVFKELATPR